MLGSFAQQIYKKEIKNDVFLGNIPESSDRSIHVMNYFDIDFEQRIGKIILNYAIVKFYLNLVLSGQEKGG